MEINDFHTCRLYQAIFGPLGTHYDRQGTNFDTLNAHLDSLDAHFDPLDTNFDAWAPILVPWLLT